MCLRYVLILFIVVLCSKELLAQRTIIYCSKLIDLKNRTVMPGLIDCHVHLEGEKSADQVKEFRENIADIVAVEGDPAKDIQAMGNMKFVLKGGVVYKNG